MLMFHLSCLIFVVSVKMSTVPAKKSKVLSAQTRAIVFSVLQFALREKKAKTPLLEINKAMDRVAAMTGLCRDTLSKIKKEGATNGGIWETRIKKKRQKVKTNPNEVDKINIINKIEEFHKRNETISLRKLLKELQEDNNFSGGKTSLLIVLNSMGYKWEKNESNKKVLQKVSITPNSTPNTSYAEDKLMPEEFPTETVTSACSMEDSIAEQSVAMHRAPVPPDGPLPPGPSQVEGPPGPVNSYIQRPLLLHAPHYLFNL